MPFSHRAWVDLYEGFQAGGLRIKMTRNDPPKGSSRYGSFRGQIIDVESGRGVGEVHYNYNGASGEYEVEHDFVRLDRTHRNRGFASELETHLEDGYKRLGVKRITLTAAQVGAYTWATQGYEFAHDKLIWWPELQKHSNQATGGVDSGADIIRDHADQVTLYDLENFIRNEAEHPWQIAMWGRERAWVHEDGIVSWPGKAYLINSGWEGVKELD